MVRRIKNGEMPSHATLMELKDFNVYDVKEHKKTAKKRKAYRYAPPPDIRPLPTVPDMVRSKRKPFHSLILNPPIPPRTTPSSPIECRFVWCDKFSGAQDPPPLKIEVRRSLKREQDEEEDEDHDPKELPPSPGKVYARLHHLNEFQTVERERKSGGVDVAKRIYQDKITQETWERLGNVVDKAAKQLKEERAAGRR